MLFKTIKKQDLFDLYFSDVQCIGPKKVGTNNKGKPIYQFLPFSSFDEINLDYETTEYSAKTYFLPYKETLSSFKFKDDDWTQEITYRTRPRVIIGLHPCDINALVKLDKVFEKTLFPNPYYITRRQNTFVVGIDCKKSCDHGFCSSLGLKPVCHNPFMNNVAQLVECFHVVHEAIRLIDELVESGPGEIMAKVTPKAGEGVSAVEAPRGILFHHYKYDKTGRILMANCVVPTTQNNANIHHDIKSLVKKFAMTKEMTDEKLELLSSMLVRSYDPCVSCSVH